jgi:hypothetical protein
MACQASLVRIITDLHDILEGDSTTHVEDLAIYRAITLLAYVASIPVTVPGRDPLRIIRDKHRYEGRTPS